MPGTNKDWKQATSELCEAATYPPDEKVDLAARYRGQMADGYWDKQAEVCWRKATVDDLDTRMRMRNGRAGLLWRLAWLYVPVEMEVEFKLQGHPQTRLRWFLNGQPLPTGPFHEDAGAVRMLASREREAEGGLERGPIPRLLRRLPTLPYRAGRSRLRGKLWKLRVSDSPPAGK